ncbi:MAG: hydroxymethylbilane synthase [Planctomycetota bacterium]
MEGTVRLRRSRRPIVIASRTSQLARVQAELVAKALRKLHPVEVEFHWVQSEGDEITQGSLAEAGGKGLFTRRVDQAVLDKKADLAVHSLKDLPVDPAESLSGLALAATPKRHTVNDCLVSGKRYGRLVDLPQGAVVGTSSPRRAAQMRRLRPDFDIRLLRGNVDTRLHKVLTEDGPHYDAAVLAAAGLKRLGLGEHADRPLSVEEMLPSACQGALGIRCRATDHVTLTRCLPLNAASTSTAVTHEREVVRLLGADCYSPIAVLAQPIDPAKTQAKRNADSHWFRLRVRLCSADGQTTLESDEKCKTGELRRVVKQVTRDLLARGAREILADAAKARILDHPGRSGKPDLGTSDDAEPSPKVQFPATPFRTGADRVLAE